tara:strand:- start:325 stop:450 length:126 start_codon:yes stop_codon:yes gene_type:complete
MLKYTSELYEPILLAANRGELWEINPEKNKLIQLELNLNID